MDKNKKLKKTILRRTKTQNDGRKELDAARKNLLNKDTDFRVVEAYKTARTNLMFTLAGEEGCKKVLVTSSIAQEGKSTSSVNLAITFAQTNARVLLIEADLRHPRLHAYLDLPNKKGMAEYLGGFVENPKELIQHVPQYKFDCITSGHIPPNPTELLISPAMEHLLTALSAEYDYIFVDSPPVNVVTDSVAIAKLMTGVVVVVRQNYTRKEIVEQAVSALEFSQTKILGYVLNRSEQSNQKKYGRYKYEYRYDSYENRDSDMNV